MATRKAKKSGSKTRKPSKWMALVMKVYREMKAKNKNYKLGDAMRDAKKRKGSM